MTIMLPENNTYWDTIPHIQVTATDTYLDTIWYKVGTITEELESGVSEPLSSSIWNSLADEQQFTIYFFTNDSADNVNDTFFLTLIKDIIAPRISFIYPDPQSNNTYGDDAPEFSINIDEEYLNTSWYQLYNGSHWSENITLTGLTGTIDQTAWEIFTNGTITIIIYANDTLGHLGQT